MRSILVISALILSLSFPLSAGHEAEPSKEKSIDSTLLFDGIRARLSDLCPPGTKMKSWPPQPGQTMSPSSREHHEHKALLLFMLSHAEARLEGQPESPELANIKTLLSLGRKDVLADSLSLGIAPALDGMGATAGIAHTRGGFTAFMFGANFQEHFLQSPDYYLGVLLHELQHYRDIKELGHDDDLVRYTRQHESRGHWTEATFFKMLPEDVRKKDDRIAHKLAAASQGPDSAEWLAHLNAHQGEDYALRDRIEKFRFEKLAELPDQLQVLPELNLLAKEILIEATKLWEAESTLSASPDARAREDFQKRFAKVQTFIKSLPDLKEEIQGLPFQGRNWRAGANSLYAQREELETTVKMATIINDKLVRNPALQKLFHHSEQTHRPLNSVTAEAFDTWFQSHPDAQSMKRLFKKTFCDVEGKERKELWGMLSGHAKAEAPAIPGVSKDEIEKMAKAEPRPEGQKSLEEALGIPEPDGQARPGMGVGPLGDRALRQQADRVREFADEREKEERDLFNRMVREARLAQQLQGPFRNEGQAPQQEDFDARDGRGFPHPRGQQEQQQQPQVQQQQQPRLPPQLWPQQQMPQPPNWNGLNGNLNQRLGGAAGPRRGGLGAFAPGGALGHQDPGEAKQIAILTEDAKVVAMEEKLGGALGSTPERKRANSKAIGELKIWSPSSERFFEMAEVILDDMPAPTLEALLKDGSPLRPSQRYFVQVIADAKAGRKTTEGKLGPLSLVGLQDLSKRAPTRGSLMEKATTLAIDRASEVTGFDLKDSETLELLSELDAAPRMARIPKETLEVMSKNGPAFTERVRVALQFHPEAVKKLDEALRGDKK